MSVIWSIMPIEQVWSGGGQLQECRQISWQGVDMLVTPVADGMGRIERLLSPNPQDYLRTELQPGALVPLHHTNRV